MYRHIKRILDILFSLSALIILSPLFIILAAAVRIESPGNVIFKQKRLGRGKTHFDILKFRTMRIDTPKDMPTHLLESPDKYITATGRFLRKTSLDELPQLFNILKGDMSLIGPRPALWNQYDLIEEREKYGVNALIPGLTGWAQVNGRDELPIAVKAKYDGEYAQKLTPLFDFKIAVLTVKKVFLSEGVLEGGAKDS